MILRPDWLIRGSAAGALLWLFAYPGIRAVSQGTARDFALAGTVQSSGRQALDVIEISVDESGNQIFHRQVELSTDGTFRVHLGVLHSNQVACTLAAPGFDPQRITGLADGSATISLGVVRLKPVVELGPISVTTTQSNYSIVEFWVTSYVSRPLTVVNVSVSAMQPPSGPCFDSDPIVTMRFTMNAQRAAAQVPAQALPTVLHIESNGPQGPHDQPALLVDGSIHRDSCGPLLLRLQAPYSFTLTKDDQMTPKKIRLEVPIAIPVAKFGTVHPDWSHAVVTAEMDTKEKISGSAK
jgi:hypothetical protein